MGPDLSIISSDTLLSYGKNVDIKPSISPDGSKVAFMTSSEYAESKWRYDIAIADVGPHKVLHTIMPDPGSVLSPPVFIDPNKIRFMSFDGQRYKFWVFDVSSGKQYLLGEVTQSDIKRAKTYDFAKDAS
jgi:Tol biopolymer transport system component